MNRHENEWYNRWMSIRRLAVAAFAVTAVLIFVRFNYDGEPLTSDEMLARYDYDKRELTAAIGKCLSPLHNRNRRWDLYERWQKELKRHTAAERLRIRRDAIEIALTEARREAGLLPDDQARIDLGGVRKEVSLALVEDVAVGDYVIIHVGYALTKLDPEEAAKTLALFAELDDEARAAAMAQA